MEQATSKRNKVGHDISGIQSFPRSTARVAMDGNMSTAVLQVYFVSIALSVLLRGKPFW